MGWASDSVGGLQDAYMCIEEKWHTQRMDGMHDQLQGGLKSSRVIAGKTRAADQQMHGIECIVASLW